MLIFIAFNKMKLLEILRAPDLSSARPMVFMLCIICVPVMLQS